MALLGAMFLACTANAEISGAITNLYDAVHGAGLSLSASATRNRDSAGLLFDGITYAALVNGQDPGKRFLFNKPDGNVLPSVTVSIPAEFESGSRIVLRRVDLYPVTYWSSAKLRMPTEYKVIGIDADGFEHELHHPEGLEYPSLTENAYDGEHYDQEIPDSIATRLGFRKYKLVFLDSPGLQNNNAYPYSLMEICLQVEILPADPVLAELYGTRNFSEMLRSGGYPINFGHSYDYTWGTNGWSQAANAFDGYTFHGNTSTYGDSFRWMGYMCKPGGFFTSLRAPQEFRPGDFFVPVGCQLWSLSYNSNEILRAPTEWKLFGVVDPYTDEVWKAADETGVWEEVEHKTGLSWNGVSYNVKGQNTLGLWALPAQNEGYRAFRFRPLNSGAYAPEAAVKIDVGLAEVEIFVMPVNGKGTLRVRVDKPGCDFGECPADGALIEEAMTVTAPEFVANATAWYRVTGYRLETFDYANQHWVIGESVPSRSFAYEPDPAVSARLVWELEKVGYEIDASLQDGGNEAPVTFDPAPNASGFFNAGAEVTLTAHPNTDVLENANGATNLFRSAFVRWEGDTNGIADVTSPTITVIADRSRELHPVYRRDWLVYFYDRANEGGSGSEWRLTDGNFDLRCLKSGGFDNHSLTYNAANWVVKGWGSLDLSTKLVNSQNGSELTITAMGWPQLGSQSAPRADFTRVVVPTTLTSLACSAFRDQTNLVEAVIDCPNLTLMGNCLFTRDSKLSHLVWKAPNLTTITDNYLFFKCPMDRTDPAVDWDIHSLQSLSKGGESRFNLSECGDGHGFHGTLSLPAIRSISTSDFQNQQNVTNVVLGTEKGTLSYIGHGAFNANVSLESLTIGCTAELVVSNNAFITCSKLRNVTFVKFVPQQAAMDAILRNATPGSRASVYVSLARPLWDGFLQAIDSDKDPDPPQGAVGVYETASGDRKAWVFYKSSPLDPKGTAIIIK